ncbi:MAG: ABC transporter permease [Gemmatimonadaceae bacterium]
MRPALALKWRVRLSDVLRAALAEIRANALRSFFTLLGIIVSVAFLVAVVAIIQGMNAYVRENVAGAVIGANAFQIRRTPIRVGLFDDSEWRRVQRRRRISRTDAAAIIEALPDAEAVSIQSGWPTPQADLIWHGRTLGDVLVFGVTPPYHIVQDYRIADGRPLNDADIRDRHAVIVVGSDVAEKLFEHVAAVGEEVRIRGMPVTIVGVIARKGRVLGQSFDGFALMPISTFETLFGRRKTTTISVKMREAASVAPAMTRAEEAMRVVRHLRPGQPNDFSIETAEALVAFWKQLTRVLFTVIPAVVGIGVVVGGIVIMNIMLMSVTERTREIGIRKSVGATSADIKKQFLAEAVVLAGLGGACGVAVGGGLAMTIAAISPLPARVTAWSVVLALTLGAGVGILFGVYPASRASALDPIAALRAET